MALVSVTEKELSSREMTLELLRKRVEGFENGNKQNVALIGAKYIGKSTLLLKFYYEMLACRRVVPVYLELRKEPFQLLEKRFIESILSLLSSPIYSISNSYVKRISSGNSTLLI